MKKRILIVNLILIMMIDDAEDIFKFTQDVKKKLDRKNDLKDE